MMCDGATRFRSLVLAWCAAIAACGLSVRAAEDPNAQQEAARRASLNHVVYRDRQQQLLLRRARRAFDSGQIVEGLRLIQTLLDSPEDSHMWTGSPARLSSLYREAVQLLGSLGADAWRTYERLYGPEAARLLKEAQRAGRPADIDQIIRRYFHTEAGFRAVCWKAAWWMDRGRFGLAAHCWQQLLRSPVHAGRITPGLIQKAVLSYRWSGRIAQANEILNRYGERLVRVAGRTMSLKQW
ncbi:MAG: hypothetical protein GXP27_14395, partial [Planctomycetes bacterium]|nr:hypothetical protein [Planctomycetota bacterium]